MIQWCSSFVSAVPHNTCPPALDVGVFKSFKSNFSKACSKYLAAHPGRVITSDKLASLVAEAWPLSLSPLNIMSGFKKTGIYPINPSKVTDRQIAPSKPFQQPPTESSQDGSEDPLFTGQGRTL